MSEQPGNSLPGSLWRAALIITGSVVLIWIAVKLIASIWIWLAVIGAVVVMITAAIIAFRWWRSNRRW